MTVDVEDAARRVFQASGNDSVGNSIEVTMPTTRCRDGDVTSFRITIENPWSGNTESGFGREAYIELSVEDMKALAVFISRITK